MRNDRGEEEGEEKEKRKRRCRHGEGEYGNVFFIFKLFVLTKCGLQIPARHTKEDIE